MLIVDSLLIISLVCHEIDRAATHHQKLNIEPTKKHSVCESFGYKSFSRPNFSIHIASESVQSTLGQARLKRPYQCRNSMSNHLKVS
jgi:hypothetical protein